MYHITICTTPYVTQSFVHVHKSVGPSSQRNRQRTASLYGHIKSFFIYVLQTFTEICGARPIGNMPRSQTFPPSNFWSLTVFCPCRVWHSIAKWALQLHVDRHTLGPSNWYSFFWSSAHISNSYIVVPYAISATRLLHIHSMVVTRSISRSVSFTKKKCITQLLVHKSHVFSCIFSIICNLTC